MTTSPAAQFDPSRQASGPAGEPADSTRDRALTQVREAVLGGSVGGGLSRGNIVIAGVVGLAAVAAFIPLDVSIRGVGMMLSKAGSGPVVASVSGTIEEVEVPMRGAVGEGQLLTRIKSDDGDSTIKAVRERIAIMEKRDHELSDLIAYLQTGRRAPDLATNSEYRAWAARTASFAARTATAVQVIEASSIAVEQSQSGLDLAQTRLVTYRDLADRGLLARSRLYDYELQFTDARRSHETARSTLAQARLTLESTNRERESVGAELLARLESEQRSLTERFQELQSSLETATLVKGNATVTAPQSGYVEAVEPLYVGKNVEAGTPLYNLTPNSTDFVIKVAVSNRDVGYISVDDIAKVRVPSLGGERFRRLTAKVTRVSEEAVAQPPAMMMLAPASRRPPEFIVHLELVDATPGDTLRLRAGMYAEAEIAVQSKRSIAAFMLETMQGRGIRPMSEP